ncbi:MAG TPA: tetratricopeptide repeat protein [Verrucomicrobiales bacterium]|nr:tetratricopeptide repeat protein [Verrucomicrobiales bacterium]
MRGLMFILVLAQTASAAVTGNVRLRTGPSDTPSERAYLAAARGFQAGHWATAERWLGEFARLHSDSPHRAQAVLLRAQALYQMGEFNKAATEISKGENAAGELADGYLYWKAECRLRLEQFDAASAHLQELLRKFPDSEHALSASVTLATVSARKKDWANVVQLLRPTEGKFQVLAKARPHSSWAQEGRLLLAQALFEQQDWKTAAEELGQLPASTELHREWRRLFLLAKLENQAGKPGDALTTTARVAELARRTGQTNQLAQVHLFRAAIFEQTDDVPSALREYSRMQGSAMPAVHRREGFLRAALLQMRRENYAGAITVLDDLAKRTVSTNFVGTLNCLAGELEWLRHQSGEAGALAKARGRFARAAQSPLPEIQGRAKWGEGWCHAAEGNPQSARDAWSRAIELLGESPVAPWARMQLAQAQVRGGQHAPARATLQASVPEPLRDLAAYLALRSAVALGDYPAADLLLNQLRPRNAALADKGLLTLAQARLDAGQVPEAQLVLARLQQESPDSPLRPDADLEAIRGLVVKADWAAANTAYQLWLAKNKTHSLHARVMLDHAWAQSMQSMGGQSTNVVSAFLAVIKTHPKTEQAHLANMWLADDAFNSGTNHLGAEKIYKSISSQTNAPVALRRRATLMAGRAAMARQGFGEARKEFTRLINDQKTPAPMKTEAHFALGDLTMLELGAAGLNAATNSFYNVVQASPTNAVAARAWGRIGDACLSVSAKLPGRREDARLAYEKAVRISGPVPVAVKNQARVGWAKVLRQQAEGSADRNKKLTEAVDHLLAVVHGKHLQPGEVPDAYWRGQSGLMAMDLLSQLGKPREALELCHLMISNFPAMKTGLENRKQNFLNQLARQK